MADEVIPEHEGYFWIRMVGAESPQPYWTVAYWRDEEWWEFCGELPSYEFERVLEIGDEIEKPERYCA